MPFRFSLDSVLKLRESLEECERRRLEQAQLEMAQCTHLLEQTQAQERAVATLQSRELETGVSAANLHFSEQIRQGLRERERQLESALIELLKKRERQLAEYQTAKGKRESLSDLKEQRQSEYNEHSARREQRNADDNFLARFQQG